MLTKSELDEMRARLNGWNEGYTDNEILSEANGIILRVPDLLDALEEAQHTIESGRDNFRVHVEQQAMIHNREREERTALAVENERLREALRIVKEHAVFAVIDDGVTWLRCAVCSELLDNNIGHADDCPLEISEE